MCGKKTPCVSEEPADVCEAEKDVFLKLRADIMSSEGYESSYYTSSSSDDDTDDESVCGDRKTVSENENEQTVQGEKVYCMSCKVVIEGVYENENYMEFVDFSRNHCVDCRLRIERFWENRVEQRRGVAPAELHRYDDLFFRTTCVEFNAINISSFLFIYQKVVNMYIDRGEMAGTRIYDIIMRRKAITLDWAINTLQTKVVWKYKDPNDYRAFYFDIAFFFIFPHIYMCWPNKTPFIRHIRAFLQDKPYHLLWRNERNPDRHEYVDAFNFLSQFFNQYLFNIVSNLQNMSLANHAVNSKWGGEKHPFFLFEGEIYEMPKIKDLYHDVHVLNKTKK